VPTSWLRLSVRTGAADVDALSNFLIERGSPGVVLKRTGVDAFFSYSNDDAALRKDIGVLLEGIGQISSVGGKPRVQWKIIKEQDWQNSWKRFIKPRRIGASFWVTPPWIAPPRFRRRQVITIEPGLAFGTGTHGTTRGCMECLELVAERLQGDEFTGLDVGTGSGILAIALAKLGARKIWAIDNDPVALTVARENLRANGVAARVHLSGSELSRIKKTFSVVVANLTAETILELAGALEKKVAQNGYLILSGILHQKRNVITRCFAAKFRTVRHKRSREWVTLLLQRIE
jgi:ribosomal protein L11 methyltransferase